MKKLLIHLEADVQASTFDQITAYDAGVDHVLAHFVQAGSGPIY